MEHYPMSTASPNLPAAAAGDAFLESLAAALPEIGTAGFPLIVAVSGGADSVAMLVGLAELGVPRLLVAHAEHDLRPDAAEDREFVGSLASRLGVPFTWRRLAVCERGDEAAGEGLEARARRLRYQFLANAAQEVGARHVLVAHTADDQAETILHRVLRGTGIAGLAGMRRARELCDGVAILRPLLRIPRTVGRTFLLARLEEWHEDATNTDTTRARNFLRHEILPRCVTGHYPAAVASITRLGNQASAIASAIASAAENLLVLSTSRDAEGSVVLKTKTLAGLDPHLIAEVFVALWRREGWPQRDMTAGHYESLARLVTRTEHRTASVEARPLDQFPGGIVVRSSMHGLLAIRRQ